MKKNVMVIIFILCIILLSGNNALLFDGNNKIVVIGDENSSEFPSLFADLDNRSFTMEFWIYFLADTPNATRIIDITHSTTEYFNMMYYSQKFCLYLKSPIDGPNKIASTNTISEETWYYIVISWNSNTGELKLIMDNVQQAGSGTDASCGSNDHFYIGTKSTSGGYFHGILEEFRIWNYIMGADELQESYGEELTGSEPGLYLYYDMNEFQIDDTMEDLTGNGFDGDCSTMSDESIIYCNVWNKNISLDGVNDFITIKNAAELNSDYYTIAFWFYPEDLSSTSYLFSKGNDGYYLKIDADGQIDFNGFVTSGLALETERWYHIAAVKSITGNYIYLDGIEQEINGTSAVSVNSEPLYFGKSGTDYFMGKIDEIQLYDGAISEEEISEIIYSNYQDHADLSAWFECNRLDGGILFDRTDNLLAYLEGVDAGTTTYISNNWIKDDLKSWVTNIHAGRYVSIIDDDYFQSRLISNNTNDKITVTSDWSPMLVVEYNYLYSISDIERTVCDLQYPINLDEGYESSPISIWSSHPMAYSGGLLIEGGQISLEGNLMAGHNGLTGISEEGYEPGMIDNRLARVWYLKSEGEVTELELGFDIAAIQGQSLTLGLADNYRLLYKSEESGDFSVAGGDISISIEEEAIITFSGTALDNPLGYYSIGAINSAPLPVTLSSFTGNWTGEACSLSWITASEVNNCGWNVYRGGAQNEQFQINQELIPGFGTCTDAHQYSFIDPYENNAGEVCYYWLESISLLGASEQYGPVSVAVPEIEEQEAPPVPISHGIGCYPNPFNPSTRIALCVPISGEYNLVIYNIKGQIVQEIFIDKYLEKDEELFFNWDGENRNGKGTGTGNYLITLTGEKDRFIKKITLLR